MEEKYIELTVKTREEFVDIVADFIGTFTGEAVEFGKDSVILRTTQDTEELERELQKLDDSMELEVTKEIKENIDWIKKYQDSIEPIDVAEFYVYPSWYPPKEGKINIMINPALAFGSGHHATTYSCLELLSEVVQEEDRLLDVGCGSGILALAARFKGAVVDLCDTDVLAVDSAKDNFELNGASFNDIWEGSANKSEKEYDIVVANIIADVLKMIAPQLKSRVKSGGNLIVSGILDKKERIVTDAFSDMKIVKRIQRDEWVTIQYKG
jgi:ribosomal protein L11 methyltransferase